MNDVQDIWTELENPPEEFGAIADLYSWSLNFDTGQGPFTLYLDIIGWSEDQIGENLYAGSFPLGYMEGAKLGNALNAWAAHGSSAYGYVMRLMELEANA